MPCCRRHRCPTADWSHRGRAPRVVPDRRNGRARLGHGAAPDPGVTTHRADAPSPPLITVSDLLQGAVMKRVNLTAAVGPIVLLTGMQNTLRGRYAKTQTAQSNNEKP